MQHVAGADFATVTTLMLFKATTLSCPSFLSLRPATLEIWSVGLWTFQRKYGTRHSLVVYQHQNNSLVMFFDHHFSRTPVVPPLSAEANAQSQVHMSSKFGLCTALEAYTHRSSTRSRSVQKDQSPLPKADPKKATVPSSSSSEILLNIGSV